MNSADAYRKLAAELDAKSRREVDMRLRAELQNLARAYVRLAEQADRNMRLDVVYETPLHTERRA